MASPVFGFVPIVFLRAGVITTPRALVVVRAVVAVPAAGGRALLAVALAGATTGIGWESGRPIYSVAGRAAVEGVGAGEVDRHGGCCLWVLIGASNTPEGLSCILASEPAEVQIFCGERGITFIVKQDSKRRETLMATCRARHLCPWYLLRVCDALYWH